MNASFAAAGLDEAVPFALPLTHRFRGIDMRVGMLLRVGDNWGEWAPFPEYDDVIATRWLRGGLEAARGEWPQGQGQGQRQRQRHSIDVNAIVPALDPDTVTALVLAAVARDGCTTIKVKVGQQGQDFAQDVARVAAVRAALDDAGAPAGLIRVDVNGAWDLQSAAQRLAILDDVAGGLEYAEQPCATLAELARLRDLVRVPIAVDEAIRLSATPIAGSAVDAIRAAADVLILKALPLGGVRPSLAIAAAIGLPVVVSGSLDSSVGLSAGLALAAALPEAPLACGLGTGRLLAEDLTDKTSLPQDGRLSVVRTSPDQIALARASQRVDLAQASWWSDRLTRCLALLAADDLGDTR